jgi:fucose permease
MHTNEHFMTAKTIIWTATDRNTACCACSRYSSVVFHLGRSNGRTFVGAAALRLFSHGNVLASVACGAAVLAIMSAATLGTFDGWLLA